MELSNEYPLRSATGPGDYAKRGERRGRRRVTGLRADCRPVAPVHRRTADAVGIIVAVDLLQVAQGFPGTASAGHARTDLLSPRHLQGTSTSTARYPLRGRVGATTQ